MLPFDGHRCRASRFLHARRRRSRRDFDRRYRRARQYRGASSMTPTRSYVDATPAEIDRAADLADNCAESLASAPPAQIAKLLETIAAEIEALGDELIECASRETALPAARLTGERNRTT